MSPTERKQLKNGRVPRQPIKALVLRYLEEQGEQKAFSPWSNVTQEERDNDSALCVLADKIGTTVSSLWDSVLRTGGAATMDFNLADALLCATNQLDAWIRDPELNEAYEGVDLSRHVCSRRVCTKLIPEGEKFCSEFCQENPEATASLGPDRCRKNHLRTEENTRRRKGTKTLICMDCQNETLRQHRARKVPVAA